MPDLACPAWLATHSTALYAHLLATVPPATFAPMDLCSKTEDAQPVQLKNANLAAQPT
jgi:hypothetical protein